MLRKSLPFVGKVPIMDFNLLAKLPYTFFTQITFFNYCIVFYVNVYSELGTAPTKIPHLLTVSLSRGSVYLVARFGLHTQKSILVCLFLHPHCYVLLQAKSALETRLRFVYLVPSGYIWLCKPSNLRVLCKTVLLFNMDIHIPSKC